MKTATILIAALGAGLMLACAPVQTTPLPPTPDKATATAEAARAAATVEAGKATATAEAVTPTPTLTSTPTPTLTPIPTSVPQVLATLGPADRKWHWQCEKLRSTVKDMLHGPERTIWFDGNKTMERYSYRRLKDELKSEPEIYGTYGKGFTSETRLGHYNTLTTFLKHMEVSIEDKRYAFANVDETFKQKNHDLRGIFSAPRSKEFSDPSLVDAFDDVVDHFKLGRDVKHDQYLGLQIKYKGNFVNRKSADWRSAREELVKKVLLYHTKMKRLVDLANGKCGEMPKLEEIVLPITES